MKLWIAVLLVAALTTPLFALEPGKPIAAGRSIVVPIQKADGSSVLLIYSTNPKVDIFSVTVKREDGTVTIPPAQRVLMAPQSFAPLGNPAIVTHNKDVAGIISVGVKQAILGAEEVLQ